MKLISHRGNINGKKPELENKPEYVFKALKLGYDVEVDVWFDGGEFYLGHDNPKYKITAPFIENDKIWCHAKNIMALNEMKKINDRFGYGLHYFWHQNDDVTITSNGYLWTYPGKELTLNSIQVLPEINNEKLGDVYGVCSDVIIKYK
tara:strand:- start:11034 stop:11477 length:444 start_codon:yes stop_codon:yes gene_type:complete